MDSDLNWMGFFEIKPDMNWICNNCGLKNNPSRNQCQACFNEKSVKSLTNNKDNTDIKQDENKINDYISIAKNLKQPQLANDIRSTLPKIVTDLYDYKCQYKIDPNTGSITFYPSPHLLKKEYGKKIFKKEKFIDSKQSKHFLEKLGCKKIEYLYDFDAEIIKKNDIFHGFARSLDIAYFDHYPLRIKVSHIWLLIMHSLAAHIDVNAEKLRSKYVKHNGKKKLIIDRPEFIKGSKNNNWTSVINEFNEQIDKYTVDNISKLLENNFSVSSNLDKISTKISLMSACKHYFAYIMRCGCGFHQITLDGNKNDWISLKNKIKIILNSNR
eukprot:42489_1